MILKKENGVKVRQDYLKKGESIENKYIYKKCYYTSWLYNWTNDSITTDINSGPIDRFEWINRIDI